MQIKNNKLTLNNKLLQEKVKKYENEINELNKKNDKRVKNIKTKANKIIKELTEKNKKNKKEIKELTEKNEKQEKIINKTNVRKLTKIKVVKHTDKVITNFIIKHNGKTASKKLRYKLWYMHYGDNEDGCCFSCMNKMKLDSPSWHCGHVISNKEGGPKTIGNLHPICAKCNLDMKEQHMYRYMVYNNKIGIINLTDKIKQTYKKDKIHHNKIISILDNINKETKIMLKPTVTWFKSKSKIFDTYKLKNTIKFLLSLKYSHNSVGIMVKKDKSDTNKKGNMIIDQLHSDKKISKPILKWFQNKLVSEHESTLKYLQKF